MKLGIDVGSTTVKFVILDDQDNIVYKRYERHMSDVFRTVADLMSDLESQFPGELLVGVTGSGGMELANRLNTEFQQEVISCTEAVERLIPQTDVAIELGGEDAKITFFGKSIEQRMNGTCAGGTGAFIDQMAVLLNTDAAGLNELAKNHKVIYPIAARCGVFAKTDIQPLINEGAEHEDLAASIFQAVVGQTIAGLACGRIIEGNVAFLGGPLYFLSELRQRFIETLNLSEEQIVFPENSNYFVAIGAAYLAKDKHTVSEMISLLKKSENIKTSSKHLSPLFTTQDDYSEFKNRHSQNTVERANLADAEGSLFLGIDAGSTTTKISLIDSEGRLLYTDYSSNSGSPIEVCSHMLRKMYDSIPEKAYIAYSTSTGYGERLIQKAMRTDHGEVETVAHYTAAKRFQPKVDFILDIGGQDMKCIRIKDNAINTIVLNEACSSGCGSFIETYAKSLGITTEEFAQKAIFAEHPVDLGTRCTVFMNSMVKQSQKEGAGVDDISAGLAYSVIKNSLYKVIKLRNPEDAGDYIVVQGGTFLNDAVLRSLELVLGKEVIRPDIAGNMGAYGAALVSRNLYSNLDSEYRSTILSKEQLDEFTMETRHSKCNGCENHCQLTICIFNDGSKLITGNRCERGEGIVRSEDSDRNLFEYKGKRVFDYVPLEENEAKRGTIGIPRVLNIYENYPFWFTVFTELGFRVVLSPYSNKKMYESGIDTIPSDTACYPAKLVHGHIKWLVENGVKHIFYPSINHEFRESEKANNDFNCPIVAMYPEVISGNMAPLLKSNNVDFIHPFLPYNDDKRLKKRLKDALSHFGVTQREVSAAVDKGRTEDLRFKEDIESKASELLERVERENAHGIVLAGRPYHMDPEINHGIDKIIESYGFYIFPESSVMKLGNLPKIRVWNQWTYHNRMYDAASFCGSRDDVDLIQLNSFGCGLDAVTTDQVEEILNQHNKLYTVIKIDEGSNTGAIRIRLRSLKAAIEERKDNSIRSVKEVEDFTRAEFTEEMKEKYTLLMPQMAPIHFEMLKVALELNGYNVELLPHVDRNAIETGLKYINNDACYPSIISLGQVISALQSGKYDLNRTALLMSQTGGGCRASNYISMLRKALKEIGMEHVPVISVNAGGNLEKNSGFSFDLKLLKRAVFSVIYGDLFMKLINATRPYEIEKGSAEAIYENWKERLFQNIENKDWKEFSQNIAQIVEEYDSLPIHEDLKKPRVGVVGEILVKYHPDANNNIVDVIESEGGEAVVPELADFFTYCLKNPEFNFRQLSGSYKSYVFSRFGLRLIYSYRKPMTEALRKSKRFKPAAHIDEIAEKAEKITSLGEQCGEGWYLVGEMMEFIDDGVENIVCMQPFACLPNHVVGKGVFRPIRDYCSTANVVAIDYDPGASRVNQLNRIKLMMTVAHRNLKANEASDKS
ncbi:MAG: 2-hydroxyglutaryl-CoA dehydratase [Thermoplasmata archaeon]|nr:2-hydroxyglutaryl-CoA dehydratase [Thermoplasmata archaeon]